LRTITVSNADIQLSRDRYCCVARETVVPASCTGRISANGVNAPSFLFTEMFSTRVELLLLRTSATAQRGNFWVNPVLEAQRIQFHYHPSVMWANSAALYSSVRNKLQLTATIYSLRLGFTEPHFL